MKSYFSARFSGPAIHMAVSLLLGASLLLVCATPAGAQKKKKNEPPPAASDTAPVVPMGDEQQIDYNISEMLGAWQLGDVEKLHKDYADDVCIVNGSWAPPV